MRADATCFHSLRFFLSPGHKSHGLTPESLALRKIVLVGTGSFHSFAVTSSGQVYGWGLNSFHQLGLSPSSPSYSLDSVPAPTLIEGLDPAKHGGARVVQIAGGVHHSLFLFSDGSVWSCGRCDGFEVGLGSDEEVMKEARGREEDAKARRRELEQEVLGRLVNGQTVAGGEREPEEGEEEVRAMDGHTAALKAAEAAAQGIPLPNPYVPEPTRIAFPLASPNDATSEPKIVQISAGTRHNFAVARDGTCYAWGVGNTSQLGLGDEEEAETPTVVRSQKMEGWRVVKSSTGGQHSVVLAVKRD